jgi:uncharacterized protein (TIGR03067 family)
MRTHKFVMLLAVCAIPAVGFAEEAGDETEKLDGTWVVQSVLTDPREDNPDEGKGLRIIVSGDKVIAKLPGNDKPIGIVKIRRIRKQNPSALDFLMDGGKVTVRAIYEVEDEVLRVCWSPPGKERPTEFAPKPCSGNTLVELNRSKVGSQVGLKRVAAMARLHDQPRPSYRVFTVS